VFELRSLSCPVPLLAFDFGLDVEVASVAGIELAGWAVEVCG
jgi:hypothetical protein